MTTVINLIGMTLKKRESRPIFMWSRKFDKKGFIKFYKKGTRKFFKKGTGKRRRSCGQCGRERSGVGNMGQAGHQARISRRSQSIKIMRNCRPGGTAEPRESPPTKTPLTQSESVTG